ncbi:SsrA-binding protein [Candidatus Woesebacteria bacterium RIFCSPLOWO2_01_FULL_39_23]|uniref:SsrA-binding protein n=1 Tax=Candidatus Woesebacteria bacterium RIFCSPHIGHO2_01_FULL_40_22 TaxID=1802499 RepID=A0A1F7YFX1_9BACT|nr:MAG: SsrA-binding protein [Candidatus Woesebacteria bacterium RBG_16_40_11]OGM26231.1 MAG: SsrA-binding protein [Candidatus Woesebacteria bacterium RIFCSPHIGHO2_01_FULL_40_22]OGM36488.1 MAG: SsrA-binding protein [Candidatus Woesebacteria bacterium RIFCSPHIGHO2_12_FULL_38_9]OGM62389.1 MAG: SsrA-binding protein [Candidatus Woesebacteria bacterium RIFCSPLOWO2_01_FULL_39_23]
MTIINKKARFNYNLFERIEAGISLLGREAKSIREKRGDLSNAYAKIIDHEAFLINANIPSDAGGEYNSTRTRKLLLHKSEIISILTKIKAKKLTLVPTKMYTKGRLVKVELALAKAKRQFEKKALIKKKDIERDIERELRVKV